MGGSGEVPEFITRGFWSLWIRMVSICFLAVVCVELLHNHIWPLGPRGLLLLTLVLLFNVCLFVELQIRARKQRLCTLRLILQDCIAFVCFAEVAVCCHMMCVQDITSLAMKSGVLTS